MYDRPSRVERKVELLSDRVGEFVFDVWSLYAHLTQLTDQRHARGVRYGLAEALTLIVLAKLAGEDGVSGIADWLSHRADQLRQALGLTWAGMPHRVTLSRILGRAIEATELEQVVHHYFEPRLQASQAVVVAIDGKTLRGTIEVGQNQGRHLLAAYLPEEGLVLLQVEVAAKENEIVAAPRLLQTLDLRGKVVIGDAMHTQREISIEIVRAGGEYLWTAKGNQAEVQETITQLFEPEPVTPGFAPTPTDFRRVTVANKEHGRLEHRTLTSSAMLKDYLDWPYLEQVFKLERHTIQLNTGEVSRQVSYGLTSLTPSEAGPGRLLTLSRQYWGIESSLHYRRDVTFGEDRCRLRLGEAARIMATLNNLALMLILRQGDVNVAAARRRYAARPMEALQLIMQHA